MCRYLSLLLFIGLAWGQDSLDKLILKNGVEYLGKFQKEENGLIYFRPEEGYNYQPIEEIKVDTLIIDLMQTCIAFDIRLIKVY